MARASVRPPRHASMDSVVLDRCEFSHPLDRGGLRYPAGSTRLCSVHSDEGPEESTAPGLSVSELIVLSIPSGEDHFKFV